MTFTTPLDLRYIDGRTWLLTSEFDYRIGSNESTLMVRVPEGFVTDFASIPRPLWSCLPPTGRYGRAAVVHDFLYRSRLVSRPVADAVLLEGMTVTGVRPTIALGIYLVVRVFGWWNFGGNLEVVPRPDWDAYIAVHASTPASA